MAVNRALVDCWHAGRTRPGRRLRGAVRPTDRPPGARGAGLLRDRPAHDAGRRDAGASGRRRSSCPAGRPRCTPRARRAPIPRCSTRASRCSASATASRRWPQALGGDGRAHRTVRVRPDALDDHRSRCAAARAAGHAAGVDEPRRRRHRAAARVHRDSASTPGAPVAAFENAERGFAGVQFHPEVHAHRARPGDAAALPATTSRASVRPGPRRTSSTSRSSRSARRSAASRSSAGCPAGSTPPSPPRSCSAPIGDQLTCVFVDHGLLRAGEAEQVERDFVAATGVQPEGRRRDRAVPRRARRRRPTPRRSARRSAASSSAASSRPRARSSPRVTRSTSSCRARSTRTSSSPAAAPAPRTSRATTTSAGCPTICSSRSSNRCGRCSRTRCVASASSSACPPRSSGASRSPGPDSASASSAR